MRGGYYQGDQKKHHSGDAADDVETQTASPGRERVGKC